MNDDYLNELKAHFGIHFDIFKELNIYFWIASGSIRDFVTGDSPVDIDFFFSSRKDMLTASNKLIEIEAKKIRDLPKGERFKYNNNVYVSLPLYTTRSIFHLCLFIFTYKTTYRIDSGHL